MGAECRRTDGEECPLPSRLGVWWVLCRDVTKFKFDDVRILATSDINLKSILFTYLFSQFC